jgi:hypothetical protein
LFIGFIQKTKIKRRRNIAGNFNIRVILANNRVVFCNNRVNTGFVESGPQPATLAKKLMCLQKVTS